MTASRPASPSSAAPSSAPGSAGAPFTWDNRHPTVRTPVFARNIVATSQPLAAQAGLAILRNGGNAVDAAMAAAAVIALTEPVSNGIGSDCFAIVWDGRGLHGLNSSGWSPSAWDQAYFEREPVADLQFVLGVAVAELETSAIGVRPRDAHVLG